MNRESRKPSWLKRSLPVGGRYEEVRRLLGSAGLHTVCQEARCPNQWECFSHQTATFLILGNLCTRNCSFCAVEHGQPVPPDPGEPERIARAAEKLGLKHVVITSVTRDDLGDGGASIFADTIERLHRGNPGITIEVLIPDFQGNPDALETVIRSNPTVINHNIETVFRLYPSVRPQASYHRSLGLLAAVKKIAPHIRTKSGLMLGLGESDPEVEQTMRDLLDHACDLLTVGQYLQPGRHHLPVQEFISPDQFQRWQEKAVALGFRKAVCGPFVRSSYQAGKLLQVE